MSEVKRTKTIDKIGLIGSLVNGILFLLKLIVGLITGSIAMTTDAFNNLSDFANIVITYIALKLSLKPADEDHPYGHERFEIIAGFTVSLIMILIAVESIRTGIASFFHGGESMINIQVVAISSFAILLKFILMLVYRYYSTKLESPLLKTNEYDSLFDVLISCSLIVAYFLQPYVSLNLDASMGVIIGIIIFMTAIGLLKDFISGLLGRKASDEEIEGILEILDNNTSIAGYHDLSIHSYGKFHKYALVHVEVDQHLSLIKAHKIIDKIEDDVLNKTGTSLDVHLDPLDLSSPEIKDVIAILKDLYRNLHPLIDFHDVRIDGTELRLEVFNPKETQISNEEIRIKTNKHLREYTVEIDFEYINLIQDYKDSKIS